MDSIEPVEEQKRFRDTLRGSIKLLWKDGYSTTWCNYYSGTIDHTRKDRNYPGW